MYFVSRQCQWPDGTLMVEVSSGGIDYANPGMLVPLFRSLGEGQEFADPRKAVEAAIEVRNAWAKITEEHVGIGHGATAGMTMPFSECTPEEAEAWAERRYEVLPKCEWCGDILGKVTFSHEFAAGDKFCRELCAESSYNDLFATCSPSGEDEEIPEHMLESFVSGEGVNKNT